MDFESLLEHYKVAGRLAEKQRYAAEFVTTLRPFQIIIYGAGAAGVSLLRSLRLHNIEPLFFVDRRWQECESTEGLAMRGPEALREVDSPDTLVILAINAEVIRRFNQGPLDNIQNYSPHAAVIRTGIRVNSLLRFINCHKRLESGTGFCLAECLDCGAETDVCPVYQEYLRQIAPGRQVLAEKPSRKFDWFGYIMGQYCSLKCKDCCERVPYFEHPVFSKCEEILSDCTKLAASSEFIRYIELIGGEPFLHPQFQKVLEGLLQIENVGYVKVFTNGTVVPKDGVLELLKNPRIVVNLSNYTAQAKGIQLENIRRTREVLEANGIRYIFSESKEWTDWGDFHNRGRSDAELTYNASHCFIYNCHRVFQGKIYHCPPAVCRDSTGQVVFDRG